MLAWRTAMKPHSSNSQFSLPYERNQLLGVVTPFVGEANRDAVAAVCPQFLDQSVVKFAHPFALEKFDDLALPCGNSLRLRQRLSRV